VKNKEIKVIPTLGGLAFVVIVVIFCRKEKSRRAAIKQEDEHWFERELYFWKEAECYKNNDETFYEFFNDAYGTEEELEQEKRRDDDDT